MTYSPHSAGPDWGLIGEYGDEAGTANEPNIGKINKMNNACVINIVPVIPWGPSEVI